ncbi:GNAT family N-acetyltransferase [Candidatus Bipolaricaulota bacterium]|nr:GNAT family N-acetyltransferase [Candidatus Bipolaricaulota bacterium]
MARAIENSRYHVSAYDGGTLVGFGRIVSDGALHALVFDLIVHPSHQRRGIGSEILTQLLAFCRKEGIPDVQLFAAQGKAPFYERHGFKERPGNAPGMELLQDESADACEPATWDC